MADTALEVAKLVVQALTPLVVGYLGWKLSKRLKDIEQAQWANRKLTEKRIQIYDEVSPLLNRLYCYYTYVGDWQKHSPAEILETKRVLDLKIYVNKYLLEPEVFKAYQEFIDLLFEHFTGMGQNAKLRTSFQDRTSSPTVTWQPAWASCFSSSKPASLPHVTKAYENVMLAQRKGINA